jgi:hypothetical protein
VPSLIQGVSLLLSIQLCLAQRPPSSVDKPVPESLRADFFAGLSRLMVCEKSEDWSCQAELLSSLELQDRNKTEWVRERKKLGSFFGRRLREHTVESVHSYGSPTNDEDTSALIYGCAQLKGERRGYQFLIEAMREGGQWRFIGPATVSQIDGPAERCDLKPK